MLQLKSILPILLCLSATLLLSQCSGSAGEDTNGYGKEYPLTKQSMPLIDSAMNLMQADPALSHHIVDSVCQARLMSPQRCDYYHAMILDTGEDNHDSALAICNRILDEGRFGDDQYLEEEICELASNITFYLGRYLQSLEYVNRGIAICHGHEEMNYDEALMLGRAGHTEQMIGRFDAARQTYAEANRLIAQDKTFGGLIARISLLKKQISLYFETKEFDKALAACHEALDLVEGFHRDPTATEHRPEPMATSGEATHGFADFYLSQMYCRIAKLYRHLCETDGAGQTSAYLDSVNLYLDKWLQTESHATPSNYANAIQELYFTGRTAEFAEAKAAVASLYQGDSIVSDYVEYLRLLAAEADSRHDIQASSGYLQRALAISDSIRQHETLRTLTEQMSIHMVQQQQLARQEAESQASRYRLIIAIIVTLLASSLIIAVLRRRNKRNEEVLLQTRQELIQTKEEVNDMIQQFEESKEEKTAKDMQELYDRILQALEEKKLYLNPDFNMVMLAEEMCTNRTFISSCINTITGKSFRAWLAEYRLNIFLTKQKESPDMPIDQLLVQCGYNDRSTFQRQFKAIYGTTPSKYKDPDREDPLLTATTTSSDAVPRPTIADSSSNNNQ